MSAVDHPEQGAEQAWLDQAYRYLELMQSRTTEALAVSDRAVSDENTADARVAQWHLRKREEALRGGAGPLCFGRIDEAGYGARPGDRWYIGRRHVEDEEGEPVIIDWRAPLSAPFYRATAVDPCGLDARRRYSIVDAELVAIFDEDLTDPDGASAAGLPDPLLAELDRARTGQMRDIVATIAGEQDVVIRAELDELLVVQGGPGTGKTAVGLHRAAFLLFQHREYLADTRVLVVGPNQLFLRYIAEVLPSLGETSVVQTTAAALLGARFPVRAEDPDEVAAIKGDGRMAAVVANAVRSRLTIPSEGLDMKSGVSIIRLTADELEQLQKTALARSLPTNDAREVFRQLLVQEAWRRHSERIGVDSGTQPAFVAAIRSDPGFKKSLDKMWPTLSAGAVARDLLGSPRRLSACADGLLSTEEQQLIRRKASSKLAQEQWTSADMGLLDEAGFIVAGIPTTYGHVVVDEAQDHSAMTLRMLGRRANNLSMTVLGDLAQATAPGALGSWDAALAALGADADTNARVSELTVGYRVPASVLDVANRLLPEAAPGVTPARSVRPGGAPPLIVRVDAEAKGSAAVTEIEALRESTASVAVVGVEADLDTVEASLTQAEVAVDRVGGAGLPGAEAVALVDPELVKGLEFDAVVVIEPAAIAEMTNGLRRLYVALTRSVQHLGIVHSRPLPPALVPQESGS